MMLRALVLGVRPAGVPSVSAAWFSYKGPVRGAKERAGVMQADMAVQSLSRAALLPHMQLWGLWWGPASSWLSSSLQGSGGRTGRSWHRMHVLNCQS